MTTHLFSNTFCKLEILFKLQMLKNERKEGKRRGEFRGAGREMHQFTSKESNLFNRQHKQYNLVQGTKLFFKKKNHFLFSAIPLELEHNTKYTVKELCKITWGGLSEALESTLTILIYSTSKAILKCNHKYSRHECLYAHFECLRGYHVKTLAFVRSMTSSAMKKLNKLSRPRFKEIRRETEREREKITPIQTCDG